MHHKSIDGVKWKYLNLALICLLFILDAPISTVTATEFERVIGNPVTLICSTRANPSATEWTWTKDGTSLLNHYSDTYLVDMDSLQDLGTYTCIAKNTVGQSSIIEFNVKEGTVGMFLKLPFAPYCTPFFFLWNHFCLSKFYPTEKSSFRINKYVGYKIQLKKMSYHIRVVCCQCRL